MTLRMLLFVCNFLQFVQVGFLIRNSLVLELTLGMMYLLCPVYYRIVPLIHRL
jgi:hypothetical protein